MCEDFNIDLAFSGNSAANVPAGGIDQPSPISRLDFLPTCPKKILAELRHLYLQVILSRELLLAEKIEETRCCKSSKSQRKASRKTKDIILRDHWKMNA